MDRRLEDEFVNLQLDTEDIVLETAAMLKKRYNFIMKKVLDIIAIWWIHNDIKSLTDAQNHMDELMAQVGDIIDPAYEEYVVEMTELFAEVFAFNYEYAKGALEIEDEQSHDDILLLFGMLGLASIPWVEDGLTYKERMLLRGRQLKENIRNILLRGATLGYGTRRILDMVKQEINRPKYRGTQMLVDESNHFSNEAVKYIAQGKFDGYEVSEVLDMKTCDHCRAMNGRQFTWDEYNIGITAPRFHPSCRGRIIPVTRLENGTP